MVCTEIASGVNVSLGILEELKCGVTPVGVTVPAEISVTTAVPDATHATFTRAVGDFLVDGYIIGQIVETVGTLEPENVGFHRVTGVTTTTLVVSDPNGDIVTEVATGDVNIAFEGLRATERNINLERDTIESSEVRKDRQFASVRHGFNRVAGSIGYELSLVSYDTMIHIALANTYKTVPLTAPGALVLTPNPPDTFTAVLTSATGTFTTDGVRQGTIIRMSGSGTPENNRNVIVVEVTSETALVVSNSPETMVGGDHPTTIVVPGRRIDIGTLLTTLTMIRSFNDLPKYQVFKGVTVNSMSWTLSPGEPVGGSFDMLGMSAVALADIPIANESVQPITDFLSAFDGLLYEGGEFNAIITGLEFTLENNRQLQPVVGNVFSPEVFEGRAGITGTVSAFFKGGSMFNKFFHEEDSSITVTFNNAGVSPGPGEDFIAITFPRVKYIGATIDPPQEGPVIMEMPFRSLVATVEDGGNKQITTSMTVQISNAESDERVLIAAP